MQYLRAQFIINLCTLFRYSNFHTLVHHPATLHATPTPPFSKAYSTNPLFCPNPPSTSSTPLASFQRGTGPPKLISSKTHVGTQRKSNTATKSTLKRIQVLKNWKVRKGRVKTKSHSREVSMANRALIKREGREYIENTTKTPKEMYWPT